jgi:hypothetical protein
MRLLHVGQCDVLTGWSEFRLTSKCEVRVQEDLEEAAHHVIECHSKIKKRRFKIRVDDVAGRVYRDQSANVFTLLSRKTPEVVMNNRMCQ